MCLPIWTASFVIHPAPARAAQSQCHASHIRCRARRSDHVQCCHPWTAGVSFAELFDAYNLLLSQPRQCPTNLHTARLLYVVPARSYFRFPESRLDFPPSQPTSRCCLFFGLRRQASRANIPQPQPAAHATRNTSRWGKKGRATSS